MRLEQELGVGRQQLLQNKYNTQTYSMGVDGINTNNTAQNQINQVNNLNNPHNTLPHHHPFAPQHSHSNPSSQPLPSSLSPPIPTTPTVLHLLKQRLSNDSNSMNNVMLGNVNGSGNEGSHMSFSEKMIDEENRREEE